MPYRHSRNVRLWKQKPGSAMAIKKYVTITGVPVDASVERQAYAASATLKYRDGWFSRTGDGKKLYFSNKKLIPELTGLVDTSFSTDSLFEYHNVPVHLFFSYLSHSVKITSPFSRSLDPPTSPYSTSDPDSPSQVPSPAVSITRQHSSPPGSAKKLTCITF